MAKLKAKTVEKSKPKAKVSATKSKDTSEKKKVV